MARSRDISLASWSVSGNTLVVAWSGEALKTKRPPGWVTRGVFLGWPVLLLQLNQALAQGNDHGVSTVIGHKFAHDGSHMVLHRLLADAKLVGGIFV